MKNVLLVEDNPDDVVMVKRACQRSGIPHSLQIVTDGAEALSYLAGNREYTNRTLFPLPDLVFLDINLPKHSGHEVLEWIRSRPDFKDLPVVMLTSSQLPMDVRRAYSLGVTSYLRKIAEVNEFGQAVRIILKYWLQLNIRPGDTK